MFGIRPLNPDRASLHQEPGLGNQGTGTEIWKPGSKNRGTRTGEAGPGTFPFFGSGTFSLSGYGIPHHRTFNM